MIAIAAALSGQPPHHELGHRGGVVHSRARRAHVLADGPFRDPDVAGVAVSANGSGQSHNIQRMTRLNTMQVASVINRNFFISTTKAG
jgi:hypothetical protein